MKKLAVIHFMPLEYYPPVTNFLDYISNESLVNTRVYSSHNIKNRKPYTNNRIRVARSNFPNVNESVGFRLIKYWVFNLSSLVGLFFYRPNFILYYETYSAWPVNFYLKYLNSWATLLIHFHEYSTREGYDNGMRLVKYYHRLEKKYLFKRASWISQTNKYRLRLFHKDNPELKKKKLQILANYPPLSWQMYNKSNRSKKEPYRFVYVGSLSLKNTYIREICRWIINQGGKVLLNIFAYNLDVETENYLYSLQSEWIVFHRDGIEYNDMPAILIESDIGLILHKATTPNYVFNETNKLFEYLACGIDVIFPDVMTATLPYICRDSFPRIVEVDFNNLNNYSYVELVGEENLPKRKIDYNCESEYKKISVRIAGEV